MAVMASTVRDDCATVADRFLQCGRLDWLCATFAESRRMFVFSNSVFWYKIVLISTGP